MRRFLLLLVTRRWGWTLIAALIILGGVLWGVSSPTIAYESGLNGSYYVTATSNGDVYLWTTVKGDTEFYVARHDDFNPPIDRTKIHLDSRVSIVDRSDTVLVNQDLGDDIHATQAHVIEALTIYDTTNHVTASYQTAAYTANSGGYFDNRWWPGGIVTIFIGLLVAYVALFVRRKKRAPASDQTAPGWPFTDIPPYPANGNGSSPQGKKSSRP